MFSHAGTKLSAFHSQEDMNPTEKSICHHIVGLESSETVQRCSDTKTYTKLTLQTEQVTL